MKKGIDFSTQHYFPFQFIVLGVGLLLFAVALVVRYPLLAFGLILLGTLFLTTHYRLTIDQNLKRYREYLWILGFKKGPELPFQDIEYAYINKVERDVAYGFVARVNARKTTYHGFLKLSNGDSIFIGESRKEGKLLKRAKTISDIFNIELKKNY